jgi:hypothetical protein
MYQGHQADGSSIQNHSCGSHYPFVVGAYHCGPKPHFVWSPKGDETRFDTGIEAIQWARQQAEAKRSH